MTNEISYELIQNDELVAGTCGDNAFKEILNYAAVYEQDGPVSIYQVTKQEIDVTGPAVANGAPELPDPLEEVRGKFRGEWDYVEAGDHYYTQAQIVVYGQACAIAAAGPNAALVEVLRELVEIAEQCDSWESFPADPLEKARAALASVGVKP